MNEITLIDKRTNEEVEFRKRVRGKWIVEPDGSNARCSVCKGFDALPRFFCGWCGADMRADNLEIAKLKDRDQYIIAEAISGRTYADIGRELGLTRSRVQQICSKAGVRNE